MGNRVIENTPPILLVFNFRGNFAVMELLEKERDIIRRLLFIENAQERMGVLMDRAKRSGDLEASEKTEENQVKGCISRVWIVVSLVEGRCRIRFEAESPMVKALVALICQLYDGADPAEVPGFNPVLLEELHLDRQLSPTRLNGLHQVIEHIRAQGSERGLKIPNP